VFRTGEEESKEKMTFQIMKLNKAKENFIVSRKDALRAEKEKNRQKIWEELEAGKVVKGRVKSITNFGAFVDLGGVDGLLHIADMSWKKISHPSEIVAVGDELNIMILGFEKEKGKISLGLKQTTPDPWLEIDQRILANSVIKGKITNIQNYGVFVELEKGIEGLVHISEISWTRRFVNLHDTFAIGDMVEAKVIGVDPAERKISLSIKQLEKDPWDDVENLVTIDSVVSGKISGYGEGCSYIEMENGLEGVIFNEDISWTKRVARAQDVLKRGHAYETKILGIDRANRKVIMGIKQLKDNPWEQIIQKYPIGKTMNGEVVKVTNFGVFVKLEEDLEGLVFSGEIDPAVMEKLQPKETLKIKILKIDPGSAKIGLSAKLDETVSAESNPA
jgi:small subunit ribosomal protein S1